jgi:hypothetical protein
MVDLFRKHRYLWLLLVGVSLTSAPQAEDRQAPLKIGLALSGGVARATSHQTILISKVCWA